MYSSSSVPLSFSLSTTPLREREVPHYLLLVVSFFFRCALNFLTPPRRCNTCTTQMCEEEKRFLDSLSHRETGIEEKSTGGTTTVRNRWGGTTGKMKGKEGERGRHPFSCSLSPLSYFQYLCSSSSSQTFPPCSTCCEGISCICVFSGCSVL